jgi:D-alanine-D-alanine ligase
MKKLRVAVVCGGTSSEREVSLRSGAQVFKQLDRKRFAPVLVDISKNGVWTNKKTGKKFDPFQLKKQADLVFLALHGAFGEDGRIQSLLELIGIPYTGSGVLASALAMDKYKTWQFLRAEGIAMPETRAFTRTDYLQTSQRKAFVKKTHYPCVVKPNASGSSVGVSIARTKSDLERALKTAFKEDSTVLVQKYIKGRELTCGILGNSNARKEPMMLPPIEIISHATFFDYHAKYASKKTQEICPAPVSRRVTKNIQELARKVHVLVGCDGLTRSDFILSGKTLYFLEINTLPGMTEQSLCPKEARAAGISLKDFFSMQIDLALKKSA